MRESGPAPEDSPRRGQSVYAQTVGALVAMGLALALVYLFPALLTVIPLGVLFLWSAVLGAGIADFRQFEKAGAVITRQERTAVNYLIGAGLLFLLLVLASIWLAANS